ncbi:MAG TPA: FkbM family methyltransferase [Acidobacteriaceae bacterium]|jgi:FkbM family methyltransferase
MKELLKRSARQAGLFVANNERLGLDVDLDLARLTGYAPLKTIFDVGANFGQTACRFAQAFPAASIYSFEPVQDTFAKMKANVKRLPQVRAFQMALGDQTGTAEIHLAASAGSNSLKAVHGSTASEIIQVKTLDEVADENNVETIDLLKIDVEGFELQVLAGAARRLAQRRIRFIYAECVMDNDPEMAHTNFFDIHALLRPLGFSVVAYYAESFHLRSGCAMGNTLWALREQLPAKASGVLGNIV